MKNHTPSFPENVSAIIEILEPRRLLAAINSFVQLNLVGNRAAIFSTQQDPNLVNPWGLAINPTSGAIWIADNGKGLSTTYSAVGQPLGTTITIPSATNTLGTQGTPTGAVFNGTSGFVVSKKGLASGASTFIFATEDGTIAGWNQDVDSGNAITMVNNSASGAVYKGLTLGKLNRRVVLFAANFHAGTIDVFDQHFAPVRLARNAFKDPRIPSGFAPFNVETIHNQIYVTYAKQDSAKHDDVAGAGNGFVDVFDTSGRLLKRFSSGGLLNSPWGVVRAPTGFGPFGGDILVGNFGDGKINVFNNSGINIAQIRAPSGAVNTIDGLWSLRFGDGRNAGLLTTLFFTAGPNGEADGLFGTLRLA